MIRILARSADDLVVVKPAGMASQLTSDPRGVSLVARVRAMLPGSNPRLPHRLDRVTRGILVVALSDAAIAFQGASIRDGKWEKLYLARIPLREGLVGRHRAHLRQVGMRSTVVRSGGDPATLEIVATAPAPGRPGEAHALVRLGTGRFHQIRVMLAHLGAPLVGDRLYGGARGPFYLEHARLRYPDFTTRKETTAFLAEDPDREPVDAALLRRLGATGSGEGS